MSGIDKRPIGCEIHIDQSNNSLAGEYFTVLSFHFGDCCDNFYKKTKEVFSPIGGYLYGPDKGKTLLKWRCQTSDAKMRESDCPDDGVWYAHDRIQTCELDGVSDITAAAKAAKALTRKLDKIRESRGYASQAPEYLSRVLECLDCNCIVIKRETQAADDTWWNVMHSPGEFRQWMEQFTREQTARARKALDTSTTA